MYSHAYFNFGNLLRSDLSWKAETEAYCTVREVTLRGVCNFGGLWHACNSRSSEHKSCYGHHLIVTWSREDWGSFTIIYSLVRLTTTTRVVCEAWTS